MCLSTKLGIIYSFMQHRSTNHFKIPCYLLQLFLWRHLWSLMTSALWKHKPHSFSKLSGFLSPEELPFPQLSLVSGRMDCSCCLLFRNITVANSSASGWHGGLCSVPCSSTAHMHQVQKGKGCRRRMVQTIHGVILAPAQDQPEWQECSHSSPGSAQPLPLLIQNSKRGGWW